MLNTALRTGELLGLLNSDIDLENKTLTVRQGVKEVFKRDGVKSADGTIKALSPRQVADLLGHSTSQITELYYVKKDTSRLSGITEGFEM